MFFGKTLHCHGASNDLDGKFFYITDPGLTIFHPKVVEPVN